MKKNLPFKNLTILFLLIALLCDVEKGTAQPYQSFFGDSTTTYSIVRAQTCKKSIPPQSDFGEKKYNTKADSVIQGVFGCGITIDLMLNTNDTITIGNKLYFMTQGHWWDTLYIREEINTGQLFRYFEGNEYLICDMSLDVGDTYTFPVFDVPYHYYHEEGTTTIVDSVRYIDGKKIIYFQWLDESPYYNGHYYDAFYRLCFVEGIGPTYGPFGYSPFPMERILGVMLCVKKDDTLAYMTSPLLGCFQWGSSISEYEENLIKVYPNPATNKLKIEISDPNLHFGKIIITDIFGREVYVREAFSVSDEITVSHLSSGMYILQYVVKDKVFQSKFIKQ